MKTLISFFLITLTCLCGCKDSNKELVKRIDHIAIYYRSTIEVDSMTALFNKVLGLPQWFSPDNRDVVNIKNTSFYNTGVYLGNLFLEFIAYNPKNDTSTSKTYKPVKHAFAFTNEITNTDEVLDKRNIKRTKLVHYCFNGTNGSIDTLFTNIVLQEFRSNQLMLFFCQYHPKLFDCIAFNYRDLPKLSNPEDQHGFYENKLKTVNGGSLTIQEVESITVATSEFELYRNRFNSLLYPIKEFEPGKWKILDGPGLNLETSDDDFTLKKITIKVRSIQKAKDFLKSKNLGFEETTDYLKLDLSSNLGLDMLIIK